MLPQLFFRDEKDPSFYLDPMANQLFYTTVWLVLKVHSVLLSAWVLPGK